MYYSNEKAFPPCGICLKLKSLLKQHIRTAHSRQPSLYGLIPLYRLQKFACRYCCKKFTRKRERNKQFLAHRVIDSQTTLLSTPYIKNEVNDLANYVVESNLSGIDPYESVAYEEQKPLLSDGTKVTFDDNHGKECQNNDKYLNNAFENDGNLIDKENQDDAYQNDESCENYSKQLTIHSPYSCKLCKSTFRGAASLAEHVQYVHCDGTDDVKLRRAERNSISQSVNVPLSSYCQIVKGLNSKKRYDCLFCMYNTMKSGNIKTHYGSVHLDLRPFACTICSTTFKHKRTLVKHMKRQHLSKPVSPRRLVNKEVNDNCNETVQLGAYTDLASLNDDSKPMFNTSESLATNEQIECGDVTECYDTQVGVNMESVSTQGVDCERHPVPTSGPYSCRYCVCSFKRANGLANHIKYEHSDAAQSAQVKLRLNAQQNDRTQNADVPLSSYCRIVRKRFSSKKQYYCLFCNYNSVKSGNVKEHYRSVHMGLRPYVCTICDARFKQKSVLLHHVAKKHNAECSTNLETYEMLQKPQLASSPKTSGYYNIEMSAYCHRVKSPGATRLRYKCRFCNYDTNKTTNIRRHYESVHLNLYLFACKLCSASFKHKRSLVRHLCSRHPDSCQIGAENWSCDLKTKTETVSKLLWSTTYSGHASRKEKGLTSSENIAPETKNTIATSFKLEANSTPANNFIADNDDHGHDAQLKEPKFTGESGSDLCNVETPLPCHISDSYDVTLHSQSIKTEPVEISETVLQNSEPVENESRSLAMVFGSKPDTDVLDLSNPKIRLCQICDKRFQGDEAFEFHMRLHESPKAHCCDVCGKKYAHKASLVAHRRHHGGAYEIKSTICAVCNKKFANASYLRQHENVHKGIKPFSCEHCGRTFTHKETLRTHLRVHTGEKPYKCKLCDYRATQGTSLKKHMICMHSDVYDFACHMCEKRFKFKWQLTSHIGHHRN